jgi:hypothetical protein
MRIFVRIVKLARSNEIEIALLAPELDRSARPSAGLGGDAARRGPAPAAC